MTGCPRLKTPLIEWDEHAGRAWAFVLRAAAHVGGYQDLMFEDLRIQAGVVACGGWVTLCRSEAAQHAVLWRRFLQGYRRAARGEVVACPAVLQGAHHQSGSVPVVLRNGRGVANAQPVTRFSAFDDNKPSSLK